ncbi:MAG: ESPR domain-containing protein, partial [Phascolarctobacterium sp.]|nr:ESPR domain-containing protein [Phascolarctobacterium sp.]
MNKIFKVVWSKVKNCYVVVSEIAKNIITGGVKSAKVGTSPLVKGAALGAVMAFIITGQVWAADAYLESDYLLGWSVLGDTVNASEERSDKTITGLKGIDSITSDNASGTVSIGGVAIGTDSDGKKSIDGISLDAIRIAVGNASVDVSVLEEKVTANTNSISAMDAAYKAADATLQGNINVNTEAIAAINNETTGILAKAKGYTDEKDAKVREDFAAADTALSNRITANADNITALQGADTQIREDFAAADTQIRGEFAAADTQIRGEFAAADTQIRGEFAAADTALSNRI